MTLPFLQAIDTSLMHSELVPELIKQLRWGDYTCWEESCVLRYILSLATEAVIVQRWASSRIRRRQIRPKRLE
jgi:hypothetical protein